MKGFNRIISFLIPYKSLAIINALANILAVLFNLIVLLIMGKIVGLLFSEEAKEPILKESTGTFIDEWLFTLDKNFYDYFLSVDKSKALLYVSIAMIIAFFFKNIFVYIAQYFLAPLRSNLLRDLRVSIHKKILKLPVSYFSDKRKGDILTRVTNDVIEVENSVISTLELLIRDPFSIVVYIVSMVVISWQLTLFVFIFLPISGYIVSTVGKKLKKHSTAGQEQVSVLVSLLEEHLSGLKIIKAFNVENHSHSIFAKENETFTKINNRIRRRQDLASPMSEFLGSLIICTVFWYGGNLIFSGDASALKPAIFISYIMLFWQILAPIKNISRAYMNLQKGMASADRIFNLLDAKEETDIEKPTTSLQQFNTSIQFDNVTFSYTKGLPVLKNISFTINKGETIALVGQSGSGKSTIADLLARFYTLDSGTIWIDNKNSTDLSIKSIRDKMGIITQESILFNDTVENNIRLGLKDKTKEEVIQAATIANAHHFIEKLENGYNTNVGDRGGKLSGGQKQRVSIARALLSNPPIMIMDEATSALDTESEKLVQEALNNLLKDRTSVVIAHRLSTIINADKILVLNEGEIVEQGTHKELLEMNGYYTKLHQMQDIS